MSDPKRSASKTLTWRAVATTDTFLIAWFVTGEPWVGVSIASIEFFTKIVFYYIHERAWDRVEWGRE